MTADAPEDSAVPEDVSAEEVGDVAEGDVVATDAAAEVTPPPVCEEAPVPVLGPQMNDNTEACLECMNDGCCGEMTACAESAACLAARTCFTGCDDISGPCIDACAEANEGYLEANRGVVGCRNDRCAYECALDACVGAVEWAEPSVATRTIAHTFLDFQNRDPVEGLLVKVCAKSDVECETPLAEGTTSEAGTVTLEMPTAPGGFGAFMEVSGEGYMSTDFWFVRTDPEEGLDAGTLSWQVLSVATANLLTAFVGATLDPERGSVTFLAVDCAGTRALAGLSVAADSADEATVTLYMTGAIPSVDVTATQGGGVGALLNLPPGPAGLSGTGKDGRVWSQHTVNVRAGRMVGTNMPPTPIE